MRWITQRMPDGTMRLGPRVHHLVKRDYWAKVQRWRALLAESRSWSADRLLAYQTEQLTSLIAHAYAEVPYYRRMLDDLGCRPEEIKDGASLRQLPPLTKADLQEHLEDLVARNYPPERREYSTTGGSTGQPVGFYLDKVDSLAGEWGFMSALWSRIGYRHGDPVAILGGEPPKDGALWERRPAWNWLILSSYHLTDEHLPSMIERLRRFKPRFIKGYPSSLDLVARYLEANDEPPIDGLRGAFCASENLYAFQRARIERRLGARAFGWYGQSERVCLAGECETRPELHIFPQYGWTELVARDGSVIDRPGEIGEVVGTPFVTRSMPLIRYRTTDMAVYAPGTCPDCGRAYPRFERIEGRLQEFIITAGGRPISMTAINMHTPVFDNLRQFRFFQDTPGRVTLRVVPRSTFDAAADEAAIRAELKPKFGDDLELAAIEVVDEIPPMPSGKHTFLEQRLPIGFGDQS